ncbi:hypothetical protein CY34DRAFT_462713 [Suillus luteus UH-Slu-Lm8-n1]|uniref:Uncharacterized protein n=1 Tax=Suillus luteus UH-Slu-Lm8-n1 TaxID=930992 RepID=A0A0D0AZW5_9AGAM|nr:hypothetical protein CY34DRAFT_462713 [Suillus luteus UH-Slu-Lm8-n1]
MITTRMRLFTCFVSKNTSNAIFCIYLPASFLCPTFVSKCCHAIFLLDSHFLYTHYGRFTGGVSIWLDVAHPH